MSAYINHCAISKFVFFAGILFISVIGLNILAQTTGSRSSTNFFRTDNRSGFDAESKDDEERSEIKESRPADQDPDGHWGPALDGLQLSLRFKKQAYTNGENIIAIVLIRNVSSNSIDYDAMYTSAYPSPINISASKDQERLKIKKPPDWHGGSLRRTQLPPQSQDKYEVNLNQFFELGKGGEYVFQAHYLPTRPGDTNFFNRMYFGDPNSIQTNEIFSGKVTVTIANPP
jgi:hypothetical protein